MEENTTPPTEGREQHADNKPTVRVPLVGKYGAGLVMVLHNEDWRAIREAWGERWAVQPDKKGKPYVASNDKVAGLSRILAHRMVGAVPGDLVRYRDGDTLNLRRTNLEHLAAVDAKDWQRSQCWAPP